MQFLTLTNFTAFIALVSNVHATCYKTGIVGDKAIVANGEAGVNTACRALVGPNGSLGPKESRRVCIQVSGSTRWDFKLRVSLIRDWHASVNYLDAPMLTD